MKFFKTQGYGALLETSIRKIYVDVGNDIADMRMKNDKMVVSVYKKSDSVILLAKLFIRAIIDYFRCDCIEGVRVRRIENTDDQKQTNFDGATEKIMRQLQIYYVMPLRLSIETTRKFEDHIQKELHAWIAKLKSENAEATILEAFRYTSYGPLG